MLPSILRRQRGFTLIELLAVIAIMTVLAGLVAGAVTGIGASGQSARLQGDADTLGKAADRFFNDAFPQSYPVLSCCKITDKTPQDILFAGDLGVRLIDFEAVLPGDPKRAFVPDFLKEVPATAGLVSWRIVTATGETFFAEDGAQLVLPSNNRLDVSAATTSASTASAGQTSDYTYKLRMKKNEAALEVLKLEIPAGYGIGGQSLATNTIVGSFTGQFATDNPWLPGQVIDYAGALTATGNSNEWVLAVNYNSTAKVNNVVVSPGIIMRPDRIHKLSLSTPSTEAAGSITVTLTIPATDKAQNEATESWTLTIYGKVGSFSGTPSDPKTQANVITNPTVKGVYRWLAKEQTSIDPSAGGKDVFHAVAGNQAVVIKAAVTPTPTPTPTTAGTFLTKWGSQGTGDGQFHVPAGVAVDASGNVYVADFNHRVQKFTSSGTFVTKWGSFGSGDGQFREPRGLAVDASGNVYVSDTNNHRIQKFTSGGTFVTKWGSPGSGDGQFIEPFGVAVDASGNVYVSDKGNHRIQKFNSGGTFVTKWGSQGSGDGQFGGSFSGPSGVAVDAAGNVYVADSNNSRIQKFTSSGTFVTKWGSSGSGDGQFLPFGVAVDASGNVYVSDTNNHRIQKFTSGGTFVTKWGSLGAGDGQFNNPFGVAVDASGNVYVGDSSNHRIQKFASGN